MSTATTPARLGDVKKCPVCGSPSDPEAYYCAKCHNYYCYRCRARMQGSEPRYQCLNTECDYHGKLVCGSCDPEVKVEQPPSVRTEHEMGRWPLLVLLSLAVLFLGLFFARFPLAAAVAVGLFALACYLLSRRGSNVFGREVRFVVPRVATHHSCLRCGKPTRSTR